VIVEVGLKLGLAATLGVADGATVFVGLGSEVAVFVGGVVGRAARVEATIVDNCS
jgi:hypothetical protein